MNLKLKQGRYTLNAKDQLYQIEDGVSGGKGVYSSHPVYLVREKSGNFNVVFYKNPTPTDVIISQNQIEFKSVNNCLSTAKQQQQQAKIVKNLLALIS